MKKKTVALVFGGKSGEHEVSCKSAYSIAEKIDKTRFELFPIGISKEGEWYGPIPVSEISNFSPVNFADKRLAFLPQPNSGRIYSWPGFKELGQIDVFFPIVHGPFGEDGTIQGLFELADCAYVGAGVSGSAVGMDKILMKRILESSGIPQVNYLAYSRKHIEDYRSETIDEIEEKLSYPVFVKPANLGSSVGISKAKNTADLEQALKIACEYDRRVIVEEGRNVREIEVSVIGNENPETSEPGEIIPCNDFYDYNAKYIANESVLDIPAKLPESTRKILNELAKEAYLALNCRGFARIDFFLDKDNNELYVNEINTLPGFTTISMYPKLWEATGKGYAALLDELIELALEDYADKKRADS